ncbi:armadillo-type protein [Entophlyctis helioformis]|nr:armadillo-type protein [Entophlyctis helioformis]
MASRPPASAQRRAQRQPHQLAYTLNFNQKSQASIWTSSVATFYSSTLQMYDPQTYKTFAKDGGFARAKMAMAAQDALGGDSGSGGGGPGDDDNGLGSADALAGLGAGGGPAMVVTDSGATPHISEPLETLAVHYVVQLISLLGHHGKPVRVEAATLIYQLANILDRTLVEKDLEPILMGLETDDKGYYTCVHELFQLTGTSFSVMVIAMVAGLECFHSASDWRVRGICNAALARLVFENEQTFLQEDHLAAIWNLYFSLTSIPLMYKVFPDRIVILKALHLLAPVYSGEDAALACSVADTLLRLHEKTGSEVEAIKATLTIIFERLCGKRPSSMLGANGDQPAASNQIATTGGMAGTTAIGENNDITYSLFQDLISPHDEFAYDLLPWALEQYTLNTYASYTGAPKTPPIAWFSALNDYIVSLSNHFRATPPLVRYGACLALHSTLKLCPTFVSQNKQLWPFIVAGVLDTDYLTSFLYMSMLEMIETPDANDIRKLIARLRRTDAGLVSFDHLYTNMALSDDAATGDVSRGDILDIAVKHSPPLAPLLLHKLANSLDYLPTAYKLRQLELIRIWGRKSEKLDTFLMQMLVPLCSSEDERVQLETLRVVQAMIPGFSTASQADISFVWTYLVTLLDPKLSPILLKSVLHLVKLFPLLQLNSVAREELMSCLFRLIFNKDKDVRVLVYTMIGGASDFWKISGQMNAALAVLFLAIGDDNPKCAQAVLDQIQHLGSQTISQIFVQLAGVRDALDGPIVSRVKAYDQLATALALHKTDHRPLVDAILLYERVDEFWRFFLDDVPENQLANPDDYNYSRNFVQNPFWVSILLTKFSCSPPPLSLDPGVRRDAMPTTPAGKRRFICGFMICLLPTAGMPDVVFRRTACLALVRCCFKGMSVNPGMLRGLLEYVSQQMLVNKHWSYQVSALNILGLIVRLKAPGVAESILHQYLDLCLEFLHNTPLSIIKIAVLNFLEIMLMVFPKAMGIKLQEIRDITRVMLVDKDAEVVAGACRIFPLIFRAVTKVSTRAFHGYLQSEISTILGGGLEAAGDPLVSSLTNDESSRVVSLCIQCVGMMSEGIGNAYSVAQGLMKFTVHNNPDFRASALTAILSLLHTMEQQESSAIIWMLLPLYADPNKLVRLLFARFLRNLPNMVESRCQGLVPHNDDMAILPLTSWEEILTDTATINIVNKNLQDIMLDIDALNPHPFSVDLPAEDDGFHLPTVSEKLMARYKVLAQATTSAVPPAIQSEVVYFLQEMQKQSLLRANSILVLSEFCCQHETTFVEIGDMLINYLSQELTPDNTLLIEACILGIANISATGSHTFKQILTKISTPTVPNEGDLLALLFMSDMIKSMAVNKAPELLSKVVPVIPNTRSTLKKRMFAVYLAIDLSLVAGQDEVKLVLDAVNTFTDNLDDKSVKQQIQQATSRILAETGPKHPVFRNMLNQAKRDVKSKDASQRQQALYVFRLFAPHMSMEDCMWFVFHFLADSSLQVRTMSREIIAQAKVIEFAYPTLQRNVAKTGRRAELLALGRLPAMASLGLSINDASSQSDEDVGYMPVNDPFNSAYYSSERRSKFTRMYGLSEQSFAKLVAPVTQGVLASIEARASNIERVSPEAISKSQWLLKLEPLTILHDLIGLYPSVASELIETLLSSVESGTKLRATMGSNDMLPTSSQTNLTTDKTSDEHDVETATHKIDVLSNLLIAHDGIGTKMPHWLKRFQTVITFCCDSANKIRESLYMDIERSFYFFNEFVDIPIVSDEQFESLERYRETTHEATLEIVKSGKTEKLTTLDNRRVEMNESVDVKSEQLRRITIIALHLLSGYGLCNALSTASRVEQTAEAFHFIADMLSDEHRGLRIAAVEALVTTVQLQSESIDNTEFIEKIDNIVGELLAKLKSEYQSLYRRKADYATLISHLVIPISKHEHRLEILRLLVQMWRDPDSEVRIPSIRMVLKMGQAGLPEVLSSFEEEKVGGVASQAPVETTQQPPIQIMKELASLVNNDDYGDKDVLQELLKWRFSLPASKPGTAGGMTSKPMTPAAGSIGALPGASKPNSPGTATGGKPISPTAN